MHRVIGPSFTKNRDIQRSYGLFCRSIRVLFFVVYLFELRVFLFCHKQIIDTSFGKSQNISSMHSNKKSQIPHTRSFDTTRYWLQLFRFTSSLGTVNLFQLLMTILASFRCTTKSLIHFSELKCFVLILTFNRYRHLFRLFAFYTPIE